MSTAQNHLMVASQEDWAAAAARSPYWLPSRWAYMQVAGAMVRSVHNASRVLEIGPGSLPLVASADIMDRQQWGDRPLTYRWDVRTTPWPRIADLAYDVVVALQVWEHLQPKQTEAFQEMRRVARFAVLSLPWEWRGTSDHAGITWKHVNAWAAGARLVESVVPPKSGSRRVFLWDLHPIDTAS